MNNKTRKWINLLTVVILTLSTAASCATLEKIGIIKPKPNIIFILTDDRDMALMPYMENTNKLIAEQGATFTNYFVTSSSCCPSRASTLRGQYPHNTNILENSPGFVNFHSNGREDETIATWLNKAGYETSLIGKYLNGYPVSVPKKYIPPGWTDWHAFINHTEDLEDGWYYYNYTLSENGQLNYYGYSPEEYSTDVLGQKALDFIDQSIEKKSPFFIYLAGMAPHGPSTPAPRYEGTLPNQEYPQKPSFQEADTSDKPSIVYSLEAPGDEYDIYDANGQFQNRAETMLAVDEMVVKLVQLLEQKGQLDNTYIIFTSDNGFHMGEHGLSAGKMLAYEEDIRVPFLIRGPGIQPGTTVTQMVANIDVAPSLADMANAKAPDFVDGRSFLPLLNPETNQSMEWRKNLLIETGYLKRKSKVIAYRGIRNENFIYLEYENGELEYYDLIKDPYELDNIASKLDASTLSSLHSWLEQLKQCEAENCRQLESSQLKNFK
ncbi:MAG: sulfatase [Anaerolineales bacterium]|nr:sulfatase [Anaerolineales bacterium]